MVNRPFAKSVSWVRSIVLVQSAFERRNPLVPNCLAIGVLFRSYLTLLYKSLKAVVNGNEGLRVLPKIKSEVYQSIADIWGRSGFIAPLFEAYAHTICEFDFLSSRLSVYECRHFHVRRVTLFVFNDSQNTVYSAFPLENLRVNISAFLRIVLVEFCASRRNLAQFFLGFFQERLSWVEFFHL